MALIDCNECGKQVRDNDQHCWNCGAGMRPGVQRKRASGGGQTLATVVACGVIGVLVLAAVSGRKDTVDTAEAVQMALPALNPAVHVTLIAGAAPDSVRRLLGEPTSTDTNRHNGVEYPRSSYRNGAVEVTYIDGKADWIHLSTPAGVSFEPAALKAFGIADPPVPSFRNEHTMRWEGREGSSVPGFVGVYMFPLTSTDGIDFITFRVHTPVS